MRIIKTKKVSPMIRDQEFERITMCGQFQTTIGYMSTDVYAERCPNGRRYVVCPVCGHQITAI